MFALVAAVSVADAGLSACTSIRVEGGTMQATGSAFAPILVRPTAGQPLTIVRSEGFGWVPHGDGVTLGYHREIRALVTDLEACQVVILEPQGDSAEFARLVDLLIAAGTHLCTIPKEKP